jgi:phosphatidylserine/phosphatidylglycerophosphate/cardiolipin synthase-like enzyme
MVGLHRYFMALLVVLLLSGGSATLHAHQDPCHRLHGCPSDQNTYVWSDKGRCDQCPDNQFCLAGKPRLAASPAPAPAQPTPTSTQPSTSCGTTVCLTPGANCTELIVNAIAGAKTSILVQAYSFTSAPIAKALLDAHTRGIQVQVILDKSQRTEKYSSADFLANQGIPTKIDAAHAISHNKVVIIDGEIVITGSFNFTKTAQEKNAENVLIVRDKALAAQYTQNRDAHRSHSQPYVGRGVARSYSGDRSPRARRASVSWSGIDRCRPSAHGHVRSCHDQRAVVCATRDTHQRGTKLGRAG